MLKDKDKTWGIVQWKIDSLASEKSWVPSHPPKKTKRKNTER
jgi:hypothetical protein